jgi:hypothetical protein
LAKKILKEGHVYKKFEERGLGGIGVETWILQHGGNIREAFRAFREAALQGGSEPVPLAKFQENYSIRDAGLNTKKLQYDNFVYLLTEDSYKKMIGVIGLHKASS